MKALMLFACMALTSLSLEAKEFAEEYDEVTESVVVFNQNKSEVSGDGIKQLKTLPQGKTEIVGYASSEGSYENNLALSQRRADGIARLLGRKFALVSAVGESDANPLMDYRDRKVIITVTATELVYSPIFGGYDIVFGPTHHLQWNTIPR